MEETTVTMPINKYKEMESKAWAYEDYHRVFKVVLTYFMTDEEKTLLLQYLADKLDQIEWETVESLLFNR
ncbi:hypothetical protein [Heyndrickxia oleronia]|jgi:hypothetical protein|uniref:hypothetical protein n=1 Tax=Heyndrickxia oleronia TaxID=38875 RepID=UPI001B2BFAE8|nr:hypothetical protein [Heyndrickxia oleronia]GIN39610.1 hypothetical protein J19TS1_25590 [Heyndrickxia oleronia]